MNIRRIEHMSGITAVDGQVRIGALTTVTQIMENDLIRTSLPVLAETADCFASDQIRNAASIGGNICNASPAGDMIIPLMVLDASVELASWKDGGITTRIVPLDAFFTGPGRTTRQDNELLTAVLFNMPNQGFTACFKKSGPRPALEIAAVSMAIGGAMKEGHLRHVRAVMGAVGPTPLRAHKLEANLEGKLLDAAMIKQAAELAVEDARPIDDIRASTWYRNHLIRVYAEELLHRVAEN
jgi:CO/xanthine dehydrogenase FAD-binding subunit